MLDPTLQLPNRTRRSESIPRRLVAEGKYHLLPVYALLTTSDLAREGIRNSGSFRFADHIYRNEPSGRYGVGRVLDSVLLKLRGARSMRSRFFHSRREVLRAIREIGLADGMNLRFGLATAAHEGMARLRQASTELKQGADSLAAATLGALLAESGDSHPGIWDAENSVDQITVVSVPCGIARDLLEVAETLELSEPELWERVGFVGIDLDPEALELSRDLVGGQLGFEFRCSDALEPGSIPACVDVIVSLGFGEFLADDVLLGFYRRCHASLNDGGRFITSAMSRDRLSDYLARELAELHTHYRSREQLIDLLESAGFARVRTTQDRVGLQTLAVAERIA
ncbi:MAG TPA: class I SAM-dependent methyltransferase [Gemmatimonadaceae bacterium]|nr:class I SAM-dependent methyltransferase [Gemmatimonadaceae bacterium]